MLPSMFVALIYEADVAIPFQYEAVKAYEDVATENVE